MIERLGDVLYWLGLIVAGAFAASVVINPDALIFLIAGAIASYLTGRAFRYVLAGR